MSDKSDVSTTFINSARTQESMRHASNANAELGNIYRWLMENVVGADVYPRQLLNEVNEHFVQARTHLEAVGSSLLGIVNEEQKFFVSVLGKTQRNEKLTPAEYYHCRAFGFIEGIDEKNSEYEKYLAGNADAQAMPERRLATPEERQSHLKQLIALGKEQGYLTYSQMNDYLPTEMVDPDQIEEIGNALQDMGIPLYEKAPENDALLAPQTNAPADDEVIEEAAAALAAIDAESGGAKTRAP